MRTIYDYDRLFGSPDAPISPQAIILPIVAFPAWILCILPMGWHFSQRNIAAGSFIAWILLNNFFNSINPLIWPRDNLMDWWDGNVWCDINTRIQVGSTVGLAASTAMIVRKLAKVMDTRKITVSSSKNSILKERILEIFVCWGCPLILILVYYVVQPIRYLLYGIIGCVSAYDRSWPSIVLSIMWGPIGMCAAAYYAVLLIYRLYRYRREFSRLLSARNTTKSRFIRLFAICVFIILVYFPYTIWSTYIISLQVKDPYNWDEVHGPIFNTIMKIPVFGEVPIEKWVQVATGYVVFFVFGTGTDSYNLYKKMLLTFGLGKIFPSLYVMHQSGSTTPASFITTRLWGSRLTSKAKSMLSFTTSSSKQDTTTGTLNESVRGDSVALKSIRTEGTLPKPAKAVLQHPASSAKPSFLGCIFRSDSHDSHILPLFSRPSITEITDPNSSAVASAPSGFAAHAWAAGDVGEGRTSEADGVHVVREIHQERCARCKDDNDRVSADTWT